MDIELKLTGDQTDAILAAILIAVFVLWPLLKKRMAAR